MPTFQTEIPAVPVLIPLGLAFMFGSWLLLRRWGALSLPRLLTAWVLGGYLLGVVAVTLLPLQIALGSYANRVPWYERGSFLPLVTIDPRTFLLNIVMTVPLGLLLPLITRIRSVRQVALIALVFSATVETVQYLSDVLLSSGRLPDVNDLLANAVGAVLGYLVWRMLRQIDVLTRVSERFQIPSRPQPVRIG